MKKFSLDSVLRYRSKIKEKLEKELARAERDLESEEAKLKHYMELERLRRNELEAAQSQGAKIDYLALYYAYIERLKKMQNEQRALLERCRRARDSKRKEVLKAYQDEKILEKLKAKEEGLYRAGEKKRSQLLMDEIALRSYGVIKVK